MSYLRVAVLAVLALLAAPAQARHVPDEVMVRFRPGAAAAEVRRAIDEVGGRQVDELPGLRVRLVKLPPGLPVETAIARLAKNPNVDLAEPNLAIRAAVLPTDTYFPLQWSLDRISASRCWASDVPGSTASSPTVTIAIVDSGISSGHPDFAGRLVPGYNAIDPAASTEDDNGHGTGVAAIAGAAANNGGIAGVAWNARLMPVKILDSGGNGSEFTGLKGVLWAAEHGARVINMSYGSCDEETHLCPPGSAIGADALRQAWALGSLLVAATGNDGSSGVSYPAGYPHVVGVGATGPDDRRASYSNWGPALDVSAPGGRQSQFYCDYGSEILTASIPPVSACPGAPYTGMDPRCACASPLTTSVYVAEAGTSFAAPVVSGLAAVLIGVDPARTADQVTSLIEATADQPEGGRGWNERYGYGRVNMYRALTNAVTPPPADARSLAWTWPNPFSPVINGYATFVIPGGRGQPVTVEIRHAIRNLVWTKSLSAAETAGLDLYYNSPLRWDGRDSKGRELANGVYNARVVVGPKSCLKRVVVAR